MDLELERAILGQILAFNASDGFMAAGLRRDVFYREEHGLVLDGVLAVSQAGAEANVVTVAQWLRAADTLDRIGPAYFSALSDGVARPNAATMALQVTRLIDLHATRLATYAASKLTHNLVESRSVSDGILSQHLDEIQSILERQSTQDRPWLDVNAQLSAHQRDAIEATTGQRLHFGLHDIDDALGGVRRGEVCGLMGRPGIGKTVFLSVIARSIADVAGHVFFSLEMPASQIVGRLKQNLYGWSRYQVEERTRTGDVDEGAYRQIYDRLVIVDTPGLSVAEMGRRVRQIQNGPLKNVPIRLITIDHLGLIGGDRQLSTYDRVSVQAREIKELAKRLECAVLLAIQVNRDAGGDGSKELGLGSARDSGVVEEAMDYLIGIRRLDRSLTLTPMERERYRDVIFTKVIKNRHGDPGGQELAYRFHPVGMKLSAEPHMRPESDDIARIAQARTGSGRR